MPFPQASHLAALRICIALCLCAPFAAQAQGVPCNGEESNGNFSLSVELVAEDIGPLTDLNGAVTDLSGCLLYTSPSPRDGLLSRMPSSA